MEVDSNSSQEHVVLLGKSFPIIRCNLDLNTATMQRNIDDNSKEALLRQVSTKSDPGLDIYSAEGSETPKQEHSPELAVTSPNLNERLSAENVSTNIKAASDDDLSRVQAKDEPAQSEQLPDTHIEADDFHPVSPTDIDAVVNLALSVEDTSKTDTFEYAVDKDIVEENIQSSENVTAEAVPELNVAEPPACVNNQANVSGLELLEDTYDNAAANPLPSTVPSHNVAPSIHRGDGDIIFPPDVGDASIDPHISLSAKLNIEDYAKSEWKGTTFTANCLRRGYQKLMNETGCAFMRQVRGDNYCALRAAAFQILTRNVKTLHSYSNWKEHLLTLPLRLQQKHCCTWLNQWTFADRLHCEASDRISMMNSCLSFFIEQKELSDTMGDEMDKEAHFSALFNFGGDAEIKLFEAIKLIMLDTAVELYSANSKGEDVPVFAWLLFARDTSENPKNLMLNHLNLAGKSGGLEQVEMCLLGQALQVTVEVYRPSNVDQEDFVTHYPDHKVEQWGKICLIAEDDRHYNIVVR